MLCECARCSGRFPLSSSATTDTLALDIDPKSHPAWTGGNRQLDTGGQVARFNKRFGGLTLKK